MCNFDFINTKLYQDYCQLHMVAPTFSDIAPKVDKERYLMIHESGAHEIQNISSFRHATHLLTSYLAPYPRHCERMLIHVRRVPLLQFNLSSL